MQMCIAMAGEEEHGNFINRASNNFPSRWMAKTVRIRVEN